MDTTLAGVSQRHVLAVLRSVLNKLHEMGCLLEQAIFVRNGRQLHANLDSARCNYLATASLSGQLHIAMKERRTGSNTVAMGRLNPHAKAANKRKANSDDDEPVLVRNHKAAKGHAAESPNQSSSDDESEQGDFLDSSGSEGEEVRLARPIALYSGNCTCAKPGLVWNAGPRR